MGTKSKKLKQEERENILDEKKTIDITNNFFLMSSMIFICLIPLVFSHNVYQSFSLIKAYIFKMSFGVIGIIWAIHLLINKWNYECINKCKLFAVPLLLIVLFTGISTWQGIDPWISLVGIYTRQIGLQGIATLVLVFFILCFSLKNKDDIKKILFIFSILGLIMGVYSTFQFFNMDFFGWVKKLHDKVPSSAGNSNLAGNIFTLLLPFAIYLSCFSKQKVQKIISIVAVIFILLGIIFCKSRASWLTSIGTIVIGVLLSIGIYKDNLKNKKIFSILLLFLLFLIQFVAISFIVERYSSPLVLIFTCLLQVLIYCGWSYQDRFTGIKYKNPSILFGIIITICLMTSVPLNIYKGKEGASLRKIYFQIFHFDENPRYFLFRDSLKVIKDHFFFGTGEGTYRIAYMPYKSLENEIAEPKANYDSPHNNYLTIFATQGFFAFLCYMSIFVIFVRNGLKMIFRGDLSKEDRMLVIVLLSSFSSYLIWSMSSFDSNVTNPIVFTIYACFSSLYYFLSRENYSTPVFETTIISVVKIIVALILIPLAFLSIWSTQQIYTADQHYAKAVRIKKSALIRGQKSKEQGIRYMSAARAEINKALEYNHRESFYNVDQADVLFNLFKMTENKSYIPEVYKFLKKGKVHSWDPGKYYLVRMKLELAQGKKDEAIKYAETVLHDLPYNYIVRSQLGYLYFQRKTAEAFRKALEHFKIALQVRPQDTISLAYSGEIYLRAGKFQLAKLFAKRALQYAGKGREQIKNLLKRIDVYEKKYRKK
jgi:O-antigen ligase/tetratricopeptide (TPR) repeat protein